MAATLGLVAGCGASSAESESRDDQAATTTVATPPVVRLDVENNVESVADAGDGAGDDDAGEVRAGSSRTPGERASRAVRTVGPVLEADAPDPAVTVVDGKPWLFTTNARGANVPTVTSESGRLEVTDALPELPPWAEAGRTWAPAVHEFDGTWVLAFTARHRSSGRQCIGVATAAGVGGPYVADPEPLVCDVAAGGSIDPSFVSDAGGTTWLLWKSDGNCCGLPTEIHSARLTPDGRALAARPTTLIGADEAWEGGLVEAPSMALVDGRWLLLYSANRWDDEDYAVGAAWCDSPTGPCRKQGGPVLEASEELAGPGGAEFIEGTSGSGSFVAFHAWPPDRIGYQEGSTRTLHLGHVVIDGDDVSIEAIRT